MVVLNAIPSKMILAAAKLSPRQLLIFKDSKQNVDLIIYVNAFAPEIDS